VDFAKLSEGLHYISSILEAIKRVVAPITCAKLF
jgi:hypothetical protein